jgi:hypothetical protein
VWDTIEGALTDADTDLLWLVFSKLSFPGLLSLSSTTEGSGRRSERDGLS